MKLNVQLLVLLCWSHGLYANEMLNDFLQGLHTLQAQFEQKLYNEKGDNLETSQGQMYMQRPNKFRWDYQHPYNQLIVADGERVWIYDSDLDQVTVKNLNKALGKTPALLLSRSHHQVEQDFFINQLPSKPDLTRFELIPKDAQAQFDSMRINWRGKTLLSFELMDNLGQTTYIIFHKVKLNQPVDEGLFIFTPPAGADIINEE